LQEIRTEQARRNFGLWLKHVTPDWTWDWPHLKHVQWHLDKVTTGEIKRLMIFMPPRHGKTEMVTVRYPVWRMERDRSLSVIVGAYSQTRADNFSRKARKVARRRFPLSEERTAANDWETSQGGGMRAVGVGAGITGTGGQLIIIDDPIKGREEANSEAYRRRVWDWYTDDLYTRLEPGGSVILIQTRWHEDDLAGRILASEDGPNWTVVSLPAEAEEDDPLGREIGEALCPERYDKAALQRIKRVLGSWSYAALYQQRPMPLEGGLAKRHWFEIVDAWPAAVADVVREWDFAATAKTTASWTVGTRMSVLQGTYYIEDVVRDQIGPGAVEDLVKQTAEIDELGTRVWFEQEPGSAGKLFAASLIKLLDGYSVRAVPSTGDKVTRALPFLAQAEAGNVKLVKGPWNKAWLDEICSLPQPGRADDQWDSAAAAYEALQKKPSRGGVHRYA